MTSGRLADRVVILTGAGRAFCAGFDLKELGSGDPDKTADEAKGDIVGAMAGFEGPIIGAVNGHAVTGGFAGQCDWRLPTGAELQTIADCGFRPP